MPTSTGCLDTPAVLITQEQWFTYACAVLTTGGIHTIEPVTAVLLDAQQVHHNRKQQTSIPVTFGIASLADLCNRLDIRCAIVCLPTEAQHEHLNVRHALEHLNIPFFNLPVRSELFLPPPARRLDLASLLGRAARPIDRAAARRLLFGQRVMITGAGGSIGSELARLCATYEPGAIALVERSENALFEIARELQDRPGVRAILQDVVNERSTRRVVREFRPDVIFHTAAHKHVPMMQDHPAAAVENNVFGTQSVVDAAIDTGVERFVMISTDKAVNPKSVMGATKQLAERYVRHIAQSSTTTSLRIVRFGNVLGSACSVLPIWASQLAAENEITVTDPDMTRYFMTIPEAAGLVVEAAALPETATRGPVYVLDMGKPIRIGDLAERFVRQHGLAPVWAHTCEVKSTADNSPITLLRIIGARPGEKTHEQLAHIHERLEPSPADGILVWKGASPPQAEWVNVEGDLTRALDSETPEAIRAAISRHIAAFSPTFPKKKEIAPAA